MLCFDLELLGYGSRDSLVTSARIRTEPNLKNCSIDDAEETFAPYARTTNEG